MKYRKEIDGLRALALMPVILFHAGFANFSGGYIGVDIFFVISGYLITNLIVNEMDSNSFSLINFYERRARRVLPALFFVMFVTLPFAWFWLLPSDLRDYSKSLIAVPLFASNLVFYLTSGYFEKESESKPMLHTWSLAVEEQYYLLFPVFLMLAWKLGKRWIISLLLLIAIVSLLAAQYGSKKHIAFTFYLLPTRGFEILIGALISFYLNQRQTIPGEAFSRSFSLVGLFFIIYAIFTFDKEIPSPSLYTLIPTIGASLVIVFSNEANSVGKLLGSKLFVKVGLISYSAYLWHQPLFSFARHRSIEEPAGNLIIILVFLTLIFGGITYKFIEKPWRDNNVINKTQIFTYSLICTLIFLVFGLLGYFNEGYPSRFTPELLKLNNTRNHEALLINAGCNLDNGKFNVETCVKGNKKIPPNFALIGDSHGQAIAHELEESFKKNDISFIPFVSSGCPLNFYMEEAKKHDLQKCALYQRTIKNYLIARDDIRTYIVISRRDDPSFDKRNPDENVIRAFESNINSIKEILNLGKRVILIYPTPVHEIMVTDFMTKNILFNNGRLESVTTDSIKFKKRIKYFYDGYDSIGFQSNLVRIKTDLIFCDSFEKLKCVSQVNRIPLYYDKGHLSNDGARLIVNEIMKYIQN